MARKFSKSERLFLFDKILKMWAAFIISTLYYPLFLSHNAWQSYINFLHSPQHNKNFYWKRKSLINISRQWKINVWKSIQLVGILNIGHQNGHFWSKEPVLVLLAKCWELLIICYQSFFPKATYCKIFTLSKSLGAL